MIRINNRILSQIKSIILWGGILLSFCILTYLSIQRKENQSIREFKVEIISPSGQKSIVTDEEIKTLFDGMVGYDILKAQISDLDLKELEALVSKDGRLERATVFIDGQNRLRVRVEEKKVVLRVNSKESSYYLDEKGGKVPTVPKKAIRVPVVTGYMGQYDPVKWENEIDYPLKKVWKLALELDKDSFLSALIEQIHVDENGLMTMIPKIGREKIYLSSEDIKEKLFNLKVFYKAGLPKQGWSKYASLNLDIKGQVIAERIETIR